MSAYRDKKKGTWYITFAYKDWKGVWKRTSKRGFKTKREALDYEAEFRMHIAGNMDMSFAEFTKLYREERYVRLRVSTASTKDYMIDDKILPYFKDKKLSEIKTSDVIKWQNELIAYKNPETGKPYSQTYLKTIHNQLAAMLNYAVKFYGLKENVASKSGYIGKMHAEEMNFWTLEEYQKFSEVMMEDPESYYAFEMLYWTGCRCGEFLALTPDDIDLENKTMTISKTYQVVRGKEIVGPPKNEKGNRTVILPDKLCDELKEYISMIYDLCPTERLFTITKSKLASKINSGCKKAGVKRIRVHDLRHSHVSLLIHLGYSPLEIADRVGHQAIDITYRYAHLFPKTRNNMANRLNEEMGW